MKARKLAVLKKKIRRFPHCIRDDERKWALKIKMDPSPGAQDDENFFRTAIIKSKPERAAAAFGRRSGFLV